MWLRTKVNGAIVARNGPALAPLVRKTEDQIRALCVVERADTDVVLPGSKVAGGAEHDDGDVEQISREVEKAVKKLLGQSLLPQLLEDATCEWVAMLKDCGHEPLLKRDPKEVLFSYPGYDISGGRGILLDQSLGLCGGLRLACELMGSQRVSRSPRSGRTKWAIAMRCG
jgi:hypothetical protein